MECSPVPQAIALGLRVPCWLCGDVLHQVADERADEFTWADDSGSTAGTDADLRPLEEHGGAYAYLARLSGELERLSGLSRKRKDGYHWPDERTEAEYFARGREYSALKVRLEMGGTFHIHQVRASGKPDYEGTVPYCCGQPAWLRPSGWQCRQCRQPVTP